jgi:hypothetical protein
VDLSHASPPTRSHGLERHPGLCEALSAVPRKATAVVWTEALHADLARFAELANCSSMLAQRLFDWRTPIIGIEVPMSRGSPYCPMVPAAGTAHVAVPYPTHYRAAGAAALQARELPRPLPQLPHDHSTPRDLASVPSPRAPGAPRVGVAQWPQ